MIFYKKCDGGVFINTRQEQIIKLLKKRKQISISNLSSILHFSESTIRRDLIELERDNLLRRTPGGAVYVNTSYIENSTKIKSRIETESKRYIANLAAEFITDFQTIFLDSSSTAYILAQAIVEMKNITVFTTNLETALLLGNNKDIETHIIGGLVQDDIIHGNYPVEFLRTIHANIAFLSCKAFDSSYGCYEIYESEAIIKRTMRDNAEQCILLIDHTKFNQKATYKSLPTDQFDYIITDNIDGKDIKNITKNNFTDVIS